jgi:filamentous hemagglutinin family protein
MSALLPTLVLFLVAPDAGNAQVSVVTDITSTTGEGDLGTIVTPNGNLYGITGGTRPGGGPNLFHSFGDFSVGQGDIANFLNDSGLATSNIIGRVTGGHPSNIDGIVRTTDFGNANLFLVNPNGIVFGPHGSFDVTGSVSFSTAQYLRLFDSLNETSANFYADSASDSLGNSVFAMAPVVDFGFLSPAAYGFSEAPNPLATITVQGSLLEVSEGQSLSLVGGDITVQAGILADGTPQAANLRAPGGQLNLVSVASPGEVLVPTFQPDSISSMGTVTIKEGALLDVGGQFDEFGSLIGNGNSGTVLVRGGQLLVMDASKISANTAGTVDGAGRAVDIQVSEDVSLSNFASIVTETSGSGQGGDVVIEAESVRLFDFSEISTATSGLGQGGEVVIEAENVRLSDFSQIRTGTSGPGPGGDLSLNVGTLRLLGGLISSTTEGADSDFDGVPDVIGGVGGNVTVQGLLGAGSVADSVVLSGSSGITSAARAFSREGGRISITATSLGLDEASSIASSTNAIETDLDGDGVVDITGRGGDIVVVIQRLSILGGASLRSSADSNNADAAADGGTVTVQGLGGLGSKANSVELSGESSGIFSISSSGSGLPGDIIVDAGILTVTNGAFIAAGSSQSDGPGGAVTVTADSVVISADGQIFSRSFAQSSGQVTITADSLTLDDGSIDTSTFSERGGRGGDVVVNGGTVSLTNGASINSQSGSDDAPFSTGRAGDIIMNVRSLTMANRSEITSSSKGNGIVAPAGDAGNITIVSGSTVLLNDSSITTEAESASGGKITINAPEMIRLTNSEVSTSVEGAEGDSDGGNISIDPQFVILQNSQLIAQANAGSGGAINVIARVFIADPNSLVNASSKQGPQGTVNIQSPVQNVGGELAALSDDFASAAALLAQQCAARVSDGKFSTFVVAGREGLPLEPGGFLASPSLTAELFGSRLSGQNPQTQFSAVTGLFPIYDARPIQLAKFGNACH